MSDQQAPQSESAIEEPREKTAVGGPVPTAASTGDEILERMATIRMHIEEHSVEVMTQKEALCSALRWPMRARGWVMFWGVSSPTTVRTERGGRIVYD